jgi:hypothetical protein
MACFTKDASGNLGEEQYKVLNLKLHHLVVPPPIDVEKARKSAETDWADDSEGKHYLDFAMFLKSIFQLTDLWTYTNDFQEYKCFLINIVKGISFVDSSTGLRAFKRDSEIKFEHFVDMETDTKFEPMATKVCARSHLVALLGKVRLTTELSPSDQKEAREGTMNIKRVLETIANILQAKSTADTKIDEVNKKRKTNFTTGFDKWQKQKSQIALGKLKNPVRRASSKKVLSPMKRQQSKKAVSSAPQGSPTTNGESINKRRQSQSKKAASSSPQESPTTDGESINKRRQSQNDAGSPQQSPGSQTLRRASSLLGPRLKRPKAPELLHYARFDRFILKYFKSKFGSLKIAQRQMKLLLASVKALADSHYRIMLFARTVGLDVPGQPPFSEEYYPYLLSEYLLPVLRSLSDHLKGKRGLCDYFQQHDIELEVGDKDALAKPIEEKLEHLKEVV